MVSSWCQGPLLGRNEAEEDPGGVVAADLSQAWARHPSSCGVGAGVGTLGYPCLCFLPLHSTGMSTHGVHQAEWGPLPEDVVLCPCTLKTRQCQHMTQRCVHLRGFRNTDRSVPQPHSRFTCFCSELRVLEALNRFPGTVLQVMLADAKNHVPMGLSCSILCWVYNPVLPILALRGSFVGHAVSGS